ncbi:MAG: leucine-rich repeat protein, partial [Eubacteriales bacterium]|nr:leucine-rich repeat protein [Eubacteriales bacterium]
VEEIESYAFAGCSALVKADIPDSVEKIGNDAFGNCSSLKEIHYPANIKQVVGGSGAVFYGCPEVKEIVIPEGVTQIPAYLFADMKGLEKATLPSTLTMIEAYAFKGCTALEEITIPEQVTEIGWEAFAGCSNLLLVCFIGTPPEINDSIFSGCSENLKFEYSQVKMPEILGIYPEKGSTLGTGSRINVQLSQSTALAKLYSSYSINEEEWIKLEDQPLSGNDQVIELPFLPEKTKSGNVQLQIVCMDDKGNMGETCTVEYQVDITAPKEAVLSGNSVEGEIRLNWTSEEEEDLYGFLIQRKSPEEDEYSNIEWIEAEKKIRTYTDQLVEKDEVWDYRIVSYDVNGNTSASNAVRITVLGQQPDLEAPQSRILGNTVGEVNKEIEFWGDKSTDNRGITEWLWDFGDGSGAKKENVSHTYTAEGTYKVTLTVKDEAGNQGESELMVRVLNTSKAGILNIKVIDKNGSTVPDAGVYFDLGTDDMSILQTDGKGETVLNAPDGIYVIGVYKNGYLPASQQITVEKGVLRDLTIEIEEKELVVGEVTAERMTLEEIETAGIDVTDPANMNVVKYDLQLYYGMQSKPSQVSFCYNGNGKCISAPSVIDRGGRRVYVAGLSIPSVGGSRRYSSDITPPLAMLDIPLTASWLKDFFDVELTIVNQAESRFVLDQCNAKLNVPEGLALVDTDVSDASEVISLGSITGQESASVKWILRGDEPGSYPLSASFESVLREFGAEVKGTFEASQPVVVRDGSQLWLDIFVESTFSGDEAGIRVGFRNESQDPVYCPKIELEKVEFREVFTIDENTKEKIDASEKREILPGEEIWYDYAILRKDWNFLSDDVLKHFAWQLKEHLLKKISGMDMQYTFTIAKTGTLLSDYQMNLLYTENNEEVMFHHLSTKNLIGQTMPSITVQIRKKNAEGVYTAPAINRTVTVKDEHRGSETGTYTYVTDADGKVILPSYVIEGKDGETNLDKYVIKVISDKLSKEICVSNNMVWLTWDDEINVVNSSIVEEAEYTTVYYDLETWMDQIPLPKVTVRPADASYNFFKDQACENPITEKTVMWDDTNRICFYLKVGSQDSEQNVSEWVYEIRLNKPLFEATALFKDNGVETNITFDWSCTYLYQNANAYDQRKAIAGLILSGMIEQGDGESAVKKTMEELGLLGNGKEQYASYNFNLPTADITAYLGTIYPDPA